MDEATQAMFKVLKRAQKAIKGINADAFEIDADAFDATGRRYSVRVTSTDALRTMIKRLPGIFTVYLQGTDGFSIDVTKKALFDLLYCDESGFGVCLSPGYQIADVIIYDDLTSILFSSGR